MNLALERRLRKLENEHAKEVSGIVTRIVWERPDGQHGPGATWERKPEPVTASPMKPAECNAEDGESGSELDQLL
jgi:hypothetical protein